MKYERGIEANPRSEQAFGESGKDLLTLNNRNLSRIQHYLFCPYNDCK